MNSRCEAQHGDLAVVALQEWKGGDSWGEAPRCALCIVQPSACTCSRSASALQTEPQTAPSQSLPLVLAFPPPTFKMPRSRPSIVRTRPRARRTSSLALSRTEPLSSTAEPMAPASSGKVAMSCGAVVFFSLRSGVGMRRSEVAGPAARDAPTQ